MRYAICICIPFLVALSAGCDPSYHLAYAVVNETDDTLYVVDKKKVTPVFPDSSAQIYYEAGFGFAKSSYRESKDEVTGGLKYFDDATLCDSCAFQPSGEWKYYMLPRDDYNARLYIRSNDLK